eukprot:6209117-Prymnesium_polylepis.1
MASLCCRERYRLGRWSNAKRRAQQPARSPHRAAACHTLRPTTMSQWPRLQTLAFDLCTQGRLG